MITKLEVKTIVSLPGFKFALLIAAVNEPAVKIGLLLVTVNVVANTFVV
jgi:hypothetical protein